MKETILVFKNRAENFEKNAICLFNEGIFDLAAFNIEQARRCLSAFKIFSWRIFKGRGWTNAGCS